eukprot:jgi/Botrbrau1/19577/Bobra.0035s0062.2
MMSYGTRLPFNKEEKALSRHTQVILEKVPAAPQSRQGALGPKDVGTRGESSVLLQCQGPCLWSATVWAFQNLPIPTERCI